MNKIFGLCQNWNKQFPKFGPYMVICENNKGCFSSCDKYGRADWLPYPKMLFLFANKKIKKAFLGEINIKDGKEFAVVKRKDK